MLQLTDIKKDYKLGNGMVVNALKGVSLSFRQSEFVSILGPSGCGKTTMLNIIGGLDRYTSGDLAINGRSTKDFKNRDWDVYRNHRVGFIFQAYNLIPHQTVLGNVELALTISGIPKKERIARAKAALDEVGLSDQYYKKPNQLSGGQCQRVAIARALVNDPEILLADEPTGALDSKTSVQIMELVKEIASKRLVIMVTHNPELAEEYSTRIIKLKDGLLEDGGDSNPYNPETEATPSVTYGKVDEQIEAEAVAIDGKPLKKKGGSEKAKMSFLTAFKLSLNNLFTKKARTIMTSIAGSIGIIGVSLVLAVSWGIFGFIGNMQEDMLSGFPITIEETGFNINALMQGGGGGVRNFEMDWASEGTPAINVNDTVANLVRQMDGVENMMLSNEITQDYIDFILYFAQNNPDILAEVMLNYGLNFSNNIFASFTPAETYYRDGEPLLQSLASIRAIYAALLAASPFDDFAPFIATLDDPFRELPQSEDFVMGQYTLYGGRFATEANEVMIVLQSGRRLSDLFLAQTGMLTQNEFLNLVMEATWHMGENLNHFRDPNAPHPPGYEPTEDSAPSGFRRHYIELYDCETQGLLIDGSPLEFTFFPSSTVFASHEAGSVMLDANGNPVDDMGASFRHLSNVNQIEAHNASLLDTGKQMRVVGILRPSPGLNFGSLSSGFYYTAAFREYVLEQEKNNPSAIVQALRNAANSSISSQVNLNQTITITELQLIMMAGNLLTTTQMQDVFSIDMVLDMPLSALPPEMLGMLSIFFDIQFGIPIPSGTTHLRALAGFQITSTFLRGIFFDFEYNFVYNVLRCEDTNNVIDEDGRPIGLWRYADGTFAADENGRVIYIVMQTDADGYILLDDNDKQVPLLQNGQVIRSAVVVLDAEPRSSFAAVGSANPMAAMAGIFAGMMPPGMGDMFAGSSLSLRELSGQNSDGITIASHIALYATTFANTSIIREMLDEWNDHQGYLTFTRPNGETASIHYDNRNAIAYTDILGLMIEMLTQLVSMVTVALVGFMSLSLVVSTVMISIITYVSVVERKKEIGVIRSLGGRRLDVAYLFNAETFMIGLISGIIAIAFTFIAQAIINAAVIALVPAVSVAIVNFTWFFALAMVGLSILLTFFSGLFPSYSASKKDPVVALRSE